VPSQSLSEPPATLEVLAKAIRQEKEMQNSNTSKEISEIVKISEIAKK
jgi:hypothetical protein